MNELKMLAGPPADLEAWLLLGYAVTVLAGAQLTEALAQTHFRRARRSLERGGQTYSFLDEDRRREFEKQPATN